MRACQGLNGAPPTWHDVDTQSPSTAYYGVDWQSVVNADRPTARSQLKSCHTNMPMLNQQEIPRLLIRDMRLMIRLNKHTIDARLWLPASNHLGP